jgi:hypothetical protein
MADQVVSLSSGKDSVLGRMPGAEEMIHRFSETQTRC